jgi:hypothetical protein
MRTVSFGLERDHAGLIADPAINPAAPVCLTNCRRLIESMTFSFCFRS